MNRNDTSFSSDAPLLVTTDWLQAHLSDPALRIVDIRGHVAPATDPLPHYFNHHIDYTHSHIPGAVFIDWVHEITDPADPRHAKIASPERYAAAMSRNGIGEDTFVVAYDDAAGMFAARLWFTLNYYGHSRVAVLDGGWTKWVAEGRPVTPELPTITPAPFTPQPQPAWIRMADQVLDVVAQPNVAVLIDVRTPQEFAGQASRAKRMGHIPGAVNLPRPALNRPDGTLLSPDELRTRFAGVGVTESSAVVCYCNGGVSASYGLLALRVAGLNNSAVYDGSWKEWGNDESKPIE